MSLRDALRGGATEQELLSIVGRSVKKKEAGHAGNVYGPSAMSERALLSSEFGITFLALRITIPASF